MSLNCPVVGIDWWDAYAYANWAGGRLPTLSEWGIAAEFEGLPEAGMSWGDVDQGGKDVTGAGIVGMAGGVREWTANSEVNPAVPLAPMSYVVVGGSFRKPDKGIEVRFWASSRVQRKPDFGFRIITKR